VGERAVEKSQTTANFYRKPEARPSSRASALRQPAVAHIAMTRILPFGSPGPDGVSAFPLSS
jgi:hypothetical protein